MRHGAIALFVERAYRGRLESFRLTDENAQTVARPMPTGSTASLSRSSSRPRRVSRR